MPDPRDPDFEPIPAQPARLNNPSAPVGGPGAIAAPPHDPDFEPVSALPEHGPWESFAPPGGSQDEQTGIGRYLDKSGITGLWNLITNPKETAKNVVQQGGDWVDLLRQGKYSEAANRAGETVGNMIPGVASAGDVINDIARGEYGNIPPDMAAGLTQLLFPKILEGATEARAAGAAGRAESRFLAKSQPVIATYGPKNSLKLENDLRRAVPLVQEAADEMNNPKGGVLRAAAYPIKEANIRPRIKVDLFDPRNDNFQPAVQKALGDVDTQIDSRLNRAENAGVQIERSKLVNPVIASIPEKFKVMNPTGYQNLIDSFSRFPEYMSPKYVKDLQETTNAELSKFYDGLQAPANDALAANSHIAANEAFVRASRDALYPAADPEGMGSDFAELQRRRGSLMDLRDMHEKLINEQKKTVQPNLLQQAVGLMKPRETAIKAFTTPGSAASRIENLFNSPMERLRPIGTPGQYPAPPLTLQTQMGPRPGAQSTLPLRPEEVAIGHTGEFLTHPEGSPEFQRQRSLEETNPFVPRTNPFEEDVHAPLVVPRALYPAQNAVKPPIQQLLFPKKPARPPKFPNKKIGE